jgi:cytochrome oxidase assembly protein ShyY1
VYRFLLTPRWIGLALLMILGAATMVGLGYWQLYRYHYRSAINAQIDAASTQPPHQLTDELTPPPAGGGVGGAPGPHASWTMVSVTGHYDPAHEILARVRTLNDTVGFEVITPLVLADNTAVLVDRGWLPAPDNVTAAPVVPVVPAGSVTVVGRVHAPESEADTPLPFDGKPAVRRIDPAKLSSVVPYPLYGGYLTLQTQTPAADPAFTPIPPDYQDAEMNAGYVAQWCAFAVLTLAGLVYLIYRQAHPLPDQPDYPADYVPLPPDYVAPHDDDPAAPPDADSASTSEVDEPGVTARP